MSRVNRQAWFGARQATWGPTQPATRELNRWCVVGVLMQSVKTSGPARTVIRCRPRMRPSELAQAAAFVVKPPRGELRHESTEPTGLGSRGRQEQYKY